MCGAHLWRNRTADDTAKSFTFIALSLIVNVATCIPLEKGNGHTVAYPGFDVGVLYSPGVACEKIFVATPI